MNIKHHLTWMENVRLIQVHFSITQNDVALLLDVAESTLSWSLYHKPSPELASKLWDFIERSHDNWHTPDYWKRAVNTHRQIS